MLPVKRVFPEDILMGMSWGVGVHWVSRRLLAYRLTSSWRHRRGEGGVAIGPGCTVSLRILLDTAW